MRALCTLRFPEKVYSQTSRTLRLHSAGRILVFGALRRFAVPPFPVFVAATSLAPRGIAFLLPRDCVNALKLRLP